MSEALARISVRAILPDLTGEHYVAFLARLHATVQPKTYFEIGSRTGDSIEVASCATVAVDPEVNITRDVIGLKPSCQFFQTTSDNFFDRYNPEALFGRKIDMAFLDGMHLFEFLLRDFINTERYCRRNSLVVLHDCVPIDPYTAERIDNPSLRTEIGAHAGWWLGDVWKMMLILQKYRPELHLTVVDAAPSGLVMITNLDPGSSVLADNYHDIVAEFRDVSLVTYGVEPYLSEIDLLPTSRFHSFTEFTSRFWL